MHTTDNLIQTCTNIFNTYFNSKSNLRLLSINSYDKEDLISDVAINFFLKKDFISSENTEKYIYKMFQYAFSNISRKISRGTLKPLFYIRLADSYSDSDFGTVSEMQLEDKSKPYLDISLSFLGDEKDEFYDVVLLNFLEGKDNKDCAQMLGMGTSTFKKKKSNLVSYIKNNYTPQEFIDSLLELSK